MDARSVSEAVTALAARGYVDGFRAEGDGLRHLESGMLVPAEALLVDELLRFEGTSDPDDEAMVFAVRSVDGRVRGTWTVAFGAALDPVDGEMARRLVDVRHRKR